MFLYFFTLKYVHCRLLMTHQVREVKCDPTTLDLASRQILHTKNSHPYIRSFSVPHRNDNNLVYIFVLISSWYIRVSKLEVKVMKLSQIKCSVNFNTHFQHFNACQEHTRHLKVYLETFIFHTCLNWLLLAARFINFRIASMSISNDNHLCR